MNIRILRALMSNSYFDDVELDVRISQKTVGNGCWTCPLSNISSNTCVISGGTVINSDGSYYEKCQLSDSHIK